MSRADQGSPDPSVQPARVLIAGSNLLRRCSGSHAGNARIRHHSHRSERQEIERKLEWRPDLVLIDLRPFDVKSGSTILKSVQRSGLPGVRHRLRRGR